MHSSSPKYTCLSQTAKLQCTFRGYPGLTGAKWTNVKDEIVVDDPEEMYKEQSSTSLYVLKATESKSFDCSAAAGDVSTSKQLNVTVRCMYNSAVDFILYFLLRKAPCSCHAKIFLTAENSKAVSSLGIWFHG